MGVRPKIVTSFFWFSLNPLIYGDLGKRRDTDIPLAGSGPKNSVVAHLFP